MDMGNSLCDGFHKSGKIPDAVVHVPHKYECSVNCANFYVIKKHLIFSPNAE